MNALTISGGSAANLTMSSREIAELVDSRHDSVKRTVERLAERGVIGLPPLVEYLDSLGRTAIEYLGLSCLTTSASVATVIPRS